MATLATQAPAAQARPQPCRTPTPRNSSTELATPTRMSPPQPQVLVQVPKSPNGRRDTPLARASTWNGPRSTPTNPARESTVQFFSFEPLAIAIDGHGRILVSGGEAAAYTRGQQEPGHEDFTSRRFLPNGRRDRFFGESGVWHTNPPNSQSLARVALTQPNGQVVVGDWVQLERFGGNGPGNTAMMLTRYR